jgi:hypothetical protein
VPLTRADLENFLELILQGQERTEGNLTRAVGSLFQTQAANAAAARAVDQEKLAGFIATVQTISTSVESSNAAVKETLGQIPGSLESLKTAVGGLEKSVNGLTSNISEQLKVTGEATAKAISEAGTAQSAVLTQLAATLKEMREKPATPPDLSGLAQKGEIAEAIQTLTHALVDGKLSAPSPEPAAPAKPASAKPSLWKRFGTTWPRFVTLLGAAAVLAIFLYWAPYLYFDTTGAGTVVLNDRNVVRPVRNVAKTEEPKKTWKKHVEEPAANIASTATGDQKDLETAPAIPSKTAAKPAGDTITVSEGMRLAEKAMDMVDSSNRRMANSLDKSLESRSAVPAFGLKEVTELVTAAVNKQQQPVQYVAFQPPSQEVNESHISIEAIQPVGGWGPGYRPYYYRPRGNCYGPWY